MLTYFFDRSHRHPIYRQLYEFIKADILNGKLRSGEKLPSKRTLAEHLKISIITVENAYAQLIAEGYLYAVEKSGYYVNNIKEMPPLKPPKPSFSPPPTEPAPFIDFKTNHIAEENFPLSVLTRLMRDALHEKQGLLLPIPSNGLRELREAIAGHLYHFREMQIDSEQIIIGAGTEYLYHLLIQLLGRDKIYAVEDPGYRKIAHIYRLNDVNCRAVPLDRQGLSVAQLRSTDADILHISPSHHFPTGIVMPIGRRQELLHWAAEHETRMIIEDDYDSEFRFSGPPIPPLMSIDSQEKVIYINTFSKSIAPTIRIAYMILPPALLDRYRRTMSIYSCSVSGLDQYMLAKFIREGHFERHINRMKTLYRAKRDAVISAIQQSTFSDRVSIEEEHAGLHFLMRLDTTRSDEELLARAKEVGIRLAFLSEYTQAPTEHDRHTLVMNYSGIDILKLPQAMKLLGEILS